MMLPFWLRRRLVLNYLRSDLEKLQEAIQTCNDQIKILQPLSVVADPRSRSVSLLMEVFQAKRDQLQHTRLETLQEIQAWEGFQNAKEWTAYEERKIQTKYDVAIEEVDKYLKESEEVLRHVEGLPDFQVDHLLNEAK